MSSNSSSEAGLSGALSSLKIGASEINDEEREVTDNISTTTILCAKCGKEGGEDSMNTCNKCDLVVYCNAVCKKRHRSQHKNNCEKRAAELYDEKLFKEPPSSEDCPICFLPLLFDMHESTFCSCCGKIICTGCDYTMTESGAKIICAYCRTPPAKSDEEEVRRLKKLMEKGNADAFNQLAGYYYCGINGMPQNRAKANELYLKAGELGCAGAYCNLGNVYREGMGVEIDMKKAKHYWELAAMKGDLYARNNLGAFEGNTGNHHRAMKHFLLAARAGCELSLDSVKGGYMVGCVTTGYVDGCVTKEEYTNTLREYQKSQDEMKSEARDKARVLRNQRMGG